MNSLDLVLMLGIGLLLGLALSRVIRKRGGSGCGGNCSCCSGCSPLEKEAKKRKKR